MPAQQRLAQLAALAKAPTAQQQLGKQYLSIKDFKVTSTHEVSGDSVPFLKVDSAYPRSIDLL